MSTSLGGPTISIGDPGWRRRIAPGRGPAGRWSVRVLLSCLVLACLLPGVIGAAALFIHDYRDGRALLEKDTAQTTRALVQTVDGYLQRVQAVAQTLATDPFLVNRNFALFHQRARAAVAQVGPGFGVVLSGADGQQLLHTRRDFGQALPRHGNMEQLRRVFESGTPAISDLFLGAVLDRPLMSIDVPVFVGGEVAYVLSVGILPMHFQTILSAQGLPPEWVVSIIDSRGNIVARNRDPQRFVGRKPPADILGQIMATQEGTMENKDMDGIPVFVVYSRSPATGWGVLIGIPRETLDARLERNLGLLGAGVVALFCIGLALAWAMGGRIAHSMRALVEPALALGKGERPATPCVHTREAHEVARAIDTAGALLAQRTAELQEIHRSLLENERLLEERVRERTAELEAAHRDVETFAMAASHDLRGPLRRINSLGGMLEEKYGECLESEGRRLLAFMRENAVRLSRLVEDLLSHARVAQQALSLRELDVREAAAAVLNDKAEDIRASGAVVSAGLPAARVLADRHAFTQVLGNLLENALKYSSKVEVPRIEIGGEAAGSRFRIWVRDNGIGFDMAQHDRIFEIFQRLHNYDQYAGTGVGLALVKRAIERMGGRVWAESAPQCGATFFVELQLSPSGPDAEKTAG